LLYSTVPGAAIMFGVSVVVGLLTFGLGLFLLWPVSAVVGYQAAKSSNQRLAYEATVLPRPGGLPTASRPPARLVPRPTWTGHHPVLGRRHLDRAHQLTTSARTHRRDSMPPTHCCSRPWCGPSGGCAPGELMGLGVLCRRLRGGCAVVHVLQPSAAAVLPALRDATVAALGGRSRAPRTRGAAHGHGQRSDRLDGGGGPVGSCSRVLGRWQVTGPRHTWWHQCCAVRADRAPLLRVRVRSRAGESRLWATGALRQGRWDGVIRGGRLRL
jgi:hypothetical protein